PLRYLSVCDLKMISHCFGFVNISFCDLSRLFIFKFTEFDIFPLTKRGFAFTIFDMPLWRNRQTQG
ncbi:MAG TPA: hypothetical protein DEW35_05570, partial [Ruminococcaceae bacterium]|nr:hypothetical protein [Oscillospiraceae bacterium]